MLAPLLSFLTASQLALTVAAVPVHLRLFGTDIFPEARTEIAQATHHLGSPTAAAGSDLTARSKTHLSQGVTPSSSALERPVEPSTLTEQIPQRQTIAQAASGADGQAKKPRRPWTRLPLAKSEEVKLLDKPVSAKRDRVAGNYRYQERRKLKQAGIPEDEWPEHLKMPWRGAPRPAPPMSELELVANGPRSKYNFSEGVPLDAKAMAAAHRRRYNRAHPEIIWAQRQRAKARRQKQKLASTSGMGTSNLEATGTSSAAPGHLGEE